MEQKSGGSYGAFSGTPGQLDLAWGQWNQCDPDIPARSLFSWVWIWQLIQRQKWLLWAVADVLNNAQLQIIGSREPKWGEWEETRKMIESFSETKNELNKWKYFICRNFRTLATI